MTTTTIYSVISAMGARSYEATHREPAIEYDLTSRGTTTVRVGLVPLLLPFWMETFFLLSIQSLFNVLIGIVVYYTIVREPNTTRRYLFGYGILCPLLALWPLYLFRTVVAFHNVALMLCLAGAIPNLLLLRVVEAVHGLLPDFCYPQKEEASSMRMLLVYYAAPLQFRFDSATQQPVPLSKAVFWNKTRGFVSVLLQTSLLFSLLLPFDYTLFPEPANPSGSFVSLFHPNHLANNFLMASLLSLTLEGGAAGLGLLFSLLSGLEMEDFSRSPMTKSTSPSDFWGRRWDRPVASALKRGAFRPLRRDAGMSREMAGLVVFALSGIIHEYVLYFLSLRHGNDFEYWTSPTKGRQAAFFVYNGLLLVAERFMERARRHSSHVDEFMKCLGKLPQPVRTMLVFLLVLPIGSWFTDEYIQASFFDDSSLGFPLVTVRRIE